MKILNKLTLLGVLALGLASCSKDQIEAPRNGDLNNETHVGVTLTMAMPGQSAQTKALPNDYNHIGSWAGQDIIDNIAIYVVDNKTVSVGQYTKSDFKVTPIQGNGVNNINIAPNKAIKTTAGTKKVYALINATKNVENQLAKADPNEFEKAYQSIALKLANKKNKTSASHIASLNGGFDKITMTNSTVSSLNVQDGVSESQALDNSSPKNRASIKVQRAAARVMVTTASNSFDIKNNDKVIGKISDIRWVLAQGENSLYIQQNENYKTPAYDFVPTLDSFNKEAAKHYDYSGLLEENGGAKVATLSAYAQLSADKANQDATLQALGLTAGSVQGKFILPTTHEYGADQSTTGYRKGNTAYVLVRAKFTPNELADGANYEEGSDFFMGANGLFYSSIENAQNPETNGIEGQKVSQYIGGKVLYYAWVNPDKIPGWLNSPVVRNNIYHVQISGFKNIGTNWNPLVPTDPENPGDPNNPENPDPKPENPHEPENPIKPEDPLTLKETWMSVDMNVIPWEVHSYSIELGI